MWRNKTSNYRVILHAEAYRTYGADYASPSMRDSIIERLSYILPSESKEVHCSGGGDINDVRPTVSLQLRK